jgi:putative ABC transport system permease protein
MLQHYFVAAVRSLAHHRLYTFINIAGLSIALAAAILIVLYVRDQLSYDAWVPGTTHLYRLERGLSVPGHGLVHTAQCPFPVLKAVGEQLAPVRAFTHMAPQRATVRIGDKLFHDSVTFVDPSFFEVIHLPLLDGDPARALAQPESVVLSESFARKYFGRTDVVGRVLTVNPDLAGGCKGDDSACLNATYPLTVTGVLRDLPHNTQLLANIVAPNSSRADSMSQQAKSSEWLANNFVFGYVELAPGVMPEAVSAQIVPLLDRLVDLKKLGYSGTLSQFEPSQYFLTPFRDVHLTSDQNGGMRPPGSWTTVRALAGIAMLIVLVACCNVMNLATARASLRSREIAIRKLGGAKRRQLVAQLLGEAVLMAFISLAVALSLVEVVQPAYGRFLEAPISLSYTDGSLMALLIAGAAGVGLLGGLYPALVLSGFRPVSALKPGGAGVPGSGLLRAILVVAQFAISIGLGVAAVVVLRQIDFARHVDLGINRENVVVVHGIARMTPSERDTFASALKANPDIESLAYSRGVPFGLWGFYDVIQMPGGPRVEAEEINISPEFPTLYGMRLLAGRLLSADRAGDLWTSGGAHNLLINEAAARRLGLSPAEAVGKISYTADQAATIVGVVADANLRGVHDPLEPITFRFDNSRAGTMADLSARIRAGRIAETLAYIDRTWRTLEPGASIQRAFLSESMERFFRQDEREGTLLGIFVGIAIVIACLGLFGLTVFTAERRTKEIGVRKIVGARTSDILRLMLWRISLPVLIANLIAWPLAYHYLSRWLEGYAYRIWLSPAYFLAAGLAALFIAWATVFVHTLRLARASPVQALRYE